jgi:hypothetical protein
MKTEVYSWRLSAHKKAALETEARRRRTSVAGLLDEITSKWFADRRNGKSDETAERKALLKRVMATVGTIRSGDPRLASKVSETVRARIARKYVPEVHASRRPD